MEAKLKNLSAIFALLVLFLCVVLVIIGKLAFWPAFLIGLLALAVCIL